MTYFPKKLRKKIVERTQDKALRVLGDGNSLIDFTSNDYLGFAKNENLFARTFQLLLKHDIAENGSTGSRLLSGNHRLYNMLEVVLAEFHDTEKALVFNSGYDANIGFFASVPQRGDIVFYDEYVHASIRDGIKMGNAKSCKFKHNDIASLKEKIEVSVRSQSLTPDSEVYVVTESVFSMDGDSPDLKQFAEFCAFHKYLLVVDEAHAVGVFGKKGEGLVQELGVQKKVFARIVTFGKSMGGHGAAILGSSDLRDYLINFSRSFIYSTALTPHTIATILAAYAFLNEDGKQERKLLFDNISFFREKVKGLKLDPHFIESASAIQSCIVSGNERVKKLSNYLAESGFNVKAILSPTVPEEQERLRFCLHSTNSKEEIGLMLEQLKKYLK
ncbi:MAG: aminotransferase class I/II-fold pyridoxal phosphate-dependent enzyme [Flavobacteriaceae bacterium]